MARPRKTNGEIKDQRVPLVMAPSELEALDDWMHQNRIRSRGEAIRRLCHIGIHILPDIEVFLGSAKQAYEHFGKALKASSGKSDAERLEVYEEFFSTAAPDMLQAVVDANALKEIFAAAGHGENITEALRQAARVLTETIELSERLLFENKAEDKDPAVPEE